MDFSAATDFLGTNELLCDVMVEQPIEGEFTIPDYQPEIFKIVKAKAEPIVVQKLAVGSRATVDGYVRLTVIYQSDEDRRIFSITQKLPFSKQADLRETVGDDCVILCSAEISYLNCRAVNQRRVDVRGAANISIRVLSSAGSEVVCDIQGEGAQQRRVGVDFVRQTAMDEKQFTLEETLSVDFDGNDQPSILHCDARAIPETVSLDNGRAVVAGSVYVLLALDVSTDEEYRVKRAGFNLPFNQIVDLENAGENARPIASVHVLSVTAEVEEQDIVGIAVLCAAEVRAYEEDHATLISDAFSTRYELDMQREPVTIAQSATAIHEGISIRQTIDKPILGARLIDYFITPSSCVISRENGAAVARVGVIFSYLLSDEMGTVQCWDENMEFEVSLPNLQGSVYGAPEIAFTGVECSETDEAMTFRAEGVLYGSALGLTKLTAVKAVTPDLTRPKTKMDMALAIYYADEGEDVFMIAKAFNTSPREIALENNITDGMLDARSMLLIPIVE